MQLVDKLIGRSADFFMEIDRPLLLPIVCMHIFLGGTPNPLTE